MIQEIYEQLVQDQQMIDHFNKRTALHIRLVQEAAQRLVHRFPEYAALTTQAKVHDKSKFEEPELSPYIILSWRKKCEAEGQACMYDVVGGPEDLPYTVGDGKIDLRDFASFSRQWLKE
jgi:hypothetical protein